VNLAGRDGERLAQGGITLQLADAHTSDLIKLHMPSIRSGAARGCAGCPAGPPIL